MAPSAKSLATGERRRRAMAAALLSWHYPSRLGWLQFKPMRGVVSEVEKTPKKKKPRQGGE